MFNRKLHIDHATKLGNILKKNGVTITPKPGTILSTLTNKSTPTIDKDYDSVEDEVVAVEQAGNTMVPGYDVNLHDVELTDAIAVYKDKMKNIIDAAKTEVIPMVNRVHDVVRSKLNELRPDDVTTTVMEFDSLFDVPQAIDYMSPPSVTYISDYSLAMTQPKRDESEIAALMSVGSTIIENEVIRAITTRHKRFLVDVYDKYFVHRHALPILDEHNLPDVMLSMFIVTVIGSNLRTLKDDSILMDMGAYTPAMLEFTAQAKLRYARCMQQRETNISSQRLLITKSVADEDSRYFDPKAYATVLVNGDLYNEYLESGGTPEALLGLGVIGSNAYSIKDILGQQEHLISGYNSFMDNATTRFQSEYAERARDIVRHTILGEVDNLSEAQLNPDLDVGQLKSKINEYVSGYPRIGISENLYISIRDMVANTVFAHTDALPFITRMDEYANQRDGDMDPRVQACHAGIDLLVNNLLDQAIIAVNK